MGKKPGETTVRRADRLFDVLQTLRVARGPMTAAALAEHLEVTVRTVYRDIATLQARRVPIEGARGIGYVLRRGFDLPPLMFTDDEIEAITVGARLIRRLRDPGLRRAADSVLAKVATVLPEALKGGIGAAPFVVSDGSAETPKGIDLADLRRAIRETRKIRIVYLDARGQQTHRTVWPIAMLYYVDVTLLGAWCELRRDFRHFRVERVETSEVLPDVFPTDGGKLLERWFAAQSGLSSVPHP
jgi:predicted DNA-binding transcriptional regulator YafY